MRGAGGGDGDRTYLERVVVQIVEDGRLVSGGVGHQVGGLQQKIFDNRGHLLSQLLQNYQYFVFNILHGILYQSGQGSPAACRHHVAIEGTQSTQGRLVPEFLESEKYFCLSVGFTRKRER